MRVDSNSTPRKHIYDSIAGIRKKKIYSYICQYNMLIWYTVTNSDVDRTWKTRNKIKIDFILIFPSKDPGSRNEGWDLFNGKFDYQVSDRRGVSIIQYPWNEELASSQEMCRWEMAWTAVPAHTAVSATFFVKSDQIGHATRASASRPIKLPLSQSQRCFYWELLLNIDMDMAVLFCTALNFHSTTSYYGYNFFVNRI